MLRTTFVWALPAGRVDGANMQIAPVGRPEQEKVTGAPVPPVGVNVIFSVAVCPA